MITLQAIETKLKDNLKEQRPLLDGIEDLEKSSVTVWLKDKQLVLLDGLLTVTNDQSFTVTGTSTLLGIQGMEITASFMQDDEALVLDFEANLPADAKLRFPGLTWFDIEDVRLILTSRMAEFDVQPDSGNPIFFDTFNAAFGGTIRLDNFEIPINVRLPMGDSNDWTLSGDFESITLKSGLEELTKLAGGDSAWIEALPSQIKDLGGFAIHDVSMTFDPTLPSVSIISLAIASDTDLNIIPGKLAIENARIFIGIQNPADSAQRAIQGSFSGTIHIGGDNGVMLYVSAEVPGMRFYGALAEGSSLNFTALLEHLFPGIPNDAPNFVLHDLTVSIDASKPSARTFSIYARCYSDWEVIPKIVVLSAVEINVNYQQEVAATIIGVFKIEDVVDVTLSAAHPGNDSGWQFEGSTGAGQLIPIGALIDELGKKFGGVTLPKSIEGLEIENLQISFNTKSKDFTFTIETKFPIEGQELDMVLILEIKRQQDESYAKHFSGKITVDGLDFYVIFDSKPEATVFIAAYNDPLGHPIQVRDLVPSAIAADVPPSLYFTIKDALFAYQSTTQVPAAETAPPNPPDPAGPSKTEAPTTVETTPNPPNRAGQRTKNYLFGIDIDGGLNLSDLRLPDLPLIGPLFPPDQTLKLSFQMLVAKETFSAGDVSAFNTLLANGPTLPNKEIQDGIDLSTTLHIGQESKALDFHIGLKKAQADAASGSGSLPSATPSVNANPLDPNAKTDTGLVAVDPQKPAGDVTTSSSPSAAPAAGADGTQWIVLQKSFGPVHLERIGLAYKDSQITGLLDAALTAGGLTIALNGLSVSSPLTKLEPKFDLHGLGIDYRNGPLEIGGAFLKQTFTPLDGSAPYTVFSGLAVIRTEVLSISAIGSYAKIQDHPSMFIYAVLDYPIGGPPFFFVTGLAAGFGYNRALLMPTIDDIATFPLIEEATRKGGPPTLPTGQQAQQQTLAAELAKLETYIPPSIGQYFLALGIKFTSFKIIESFAMLAIQFGESLEFDLLGLSTLQMPPAEEGEEVTPIAEAQLALKATFIPAEGFLGVQAQLTSNSYIFSKACQLTGGFAFFSWFKDSKDRKIRGGDFVLTLGGYHPVYIPPPHYPHVPRLGINWQLNKPGDPFEFGIKGDSYFALTSHAIMAGGHLEALWHSGPLRAWFKAGADFLISWKPYHYDIRIYVDLGASLTFELFGTHTISIELGADLHLWGPEFSGTATIHILFFSFTIGFGDPNAPQEIEPIEWDEFKTSFLPANDLICSVAVQDGLIRQIDEGDSKRWILNPKDFALLTNSVIPITTTPGEALSIVPMGLHKQVTSEQIIEIRRENDPIASGMLTFTPVRKSVPAALWGEPQMDGKWLRPPDVNPPTALVHDTLAGYVITPADPPTPGATHSIDKDKFSYETEIIPDAYQWEDQSVTNLQGVEAWQSAQNTLLNDNVKKARLDLLSTLGFPANALDFGESVIQDLTIELN